MASNIHSAWFVGIEDKEKFELALRHDTLVLGQLLKIIEARLLEIDTRELDEKQFDNPNWSHLQAATVGRRNELERIRKLIKGAIG